MIPVHRECDYCEQHFTHDGKCSGNRKSYSTPCLGFKQDPRGTIKYAECDGFVIKTNQAIPELFKWNEDYEYDGRDLPIKFTKVTPVKWIVGRIVAIECNISFNYFDNSDYDNQGEKKLAEVIPMRKKDGVGNG